MFFSVWQSYLQLGSFKQWIFFLCTWATLILSLLAFLVNDPSLTKTLLDRSFGDRLEEKFLKPWKGALSSHYVCLSVRLSVCARATGHTFWPRKLIFGLSDPWDLRKKLLCCWKCLVSTQATGHSFSPRNVIFGLRDPWDMRKKRIFLFFVIFIFTLFIGIFRFFSLYNTSKFLVSSFWSQFFT